jgi:DNA primase
MSKIDTKDEILARADIIEIISDYLTLHKRGRNFIGLCPFHSEKTPSFTVSPEKQIYKCFGCGKSGNVITFLMEKNAFTFTETLKFLAGKYGIQYSFKESNPETVSEIEDILSALEESAKYFQKSLSQKEGKICREYYESRKFTKKTQEEFRLGFSPDSYDSLTKHLQNEGFSEHIITEAGINVVVENGRTYDRFRNRAIFPIFDIFGRVIGFGARNLSNEKTQAKYINSPQTKVYDKSRVLYGLSQGKNEIINKKFAILVEGYADVLTLHQNGFKNSVASSGTSLTTEQLKLLSRYSKNLQIIYDADSAGINATERAIEMALENGFSPNIVSLSPGSDPDSILRDNGTSSFQGFLDNSSDFLEFLYSKYKKSSEFENTGGKSEIIKKLMSTISLVKDKVRQDLLIQELASKFDFNDFQIRNLYKLQSNLKNDSIRKAAIRQDSQVKNEDDSENVIFEKECKAILKKMKNPEQILFNIILKNNDTFQKFKTYDFNPEKLITETAKTIYDFIFSYESLDELFHSLDEENPEPHMKSVVTTLSLTQISPSDNWDRYFSEDTAVNMKSKLQIILINLELNSLETQIKESQKRLKGVLSDLERLSTLEAINTLSKEKNKLKSQLSNI